MRKRAYGHQPRSQGPMRFDSIGCGGFGERPFGWDRGWMVGW